MSQPCTPTKFNPHYGWDTITKGRFYDALATRKPGVSIRSIVRSYAPSEATGWRWHKELQILGSPARRRLRPRSTNMGHPSQVSDETCKMLVSPSRNPVRDQQYEAQIEYYKLPIKKRQLQRRLKQSTKGGQRYKMAYVKKKIRPQNKIKRTTYGEENKDKNVDEHWRFHLFTDELHWDPAAEKQGNILREEGRREDPENIQERGELSGTRLHAAGWVTWEEKCEELEFYNDEQDKLERPKRPRKPQKRKVESIEDFDLRMKEWEALLPHEREIKPKGNSMTQKYYTERLLPVYINAIHKHRMRENGSWVLVEDGDPSHGHKKRGLAQALKEANWITTIEHPPQSPDLNPIEGIWLILKERVRKRTWHGIEEYKACIQDEWSKITMKEVRARIMEMTWRCRELARTGGKPIRSSLW